MFLIKIISLIILTNDLFYKITCCDKLLYISSNNKICLDKECSIESHTIVQIPLFQTLCIQLKDGTIQKYTISSLTKIITYKKLYFTSSWELITTSHSRCYLAGWCDTYYCRPMIKKDISSGKPHRKTNSSIFHYSGCQMSALKCRMYCGMASEGSCTWYVNEIVPIGPKYLIFEQNEVKWEVDISYFSTNGKIIQDKLTTDNPTLDLFGLPLSILSIESGKLLYNPNSLYRILLNNLFLYPIQISPINQPIIGSIGEYQISLNLQKEIFPYLQAIDCVLTGCDVDCRYSIPSIQRIITPLILALNAVSNDISLINLTNSQLSTLEHAEKFTWKDNIAYTRTPIDGSVNLILSTPDIENSFWQHPKCNFRVLYATGCKGCNTSPYVIIQAEDIQSTGTMFIISNCSLSRNYLSCQEKPLIIHILGEPDRCMITQLNKNKNSSPLPNNNTSSTLTFNINYIFEGDLNEINVLEITSVDPSIAEKVGFLLNNPNFQWGLGITFFASSGIFTLFKVFSRIISIYSAKKVNDVADLK